MRRRSLGLSQTELAVGLGLTFQQIQKYELGANRVSASKLYEAAVFLRVPITYFFEGMDDEQGHVDEARARTLNAFMVTNEGLELAQSFCRIAEHRVRREILTLARALADAENDGAVGAGGVASP